MENSKNQCELLRSLNKQLNAKILKLDLENKSNLLEIGHLKTMNEFYLENNKKLIANNQTALKLLQKDKELLLQQAQRDKENELQQTILKLQNSKNFEIQKLEKQILDMKKRTNKDVFDDTLTNNKRRKYDSDTLIASITSINYII